MSNNYNYSNLPYPPNTGQPYISPSIPSPISAPFPPYDQRSRMVMQQYNSTLNTYLQIVRGNNAIMQEMYNNILERNQQVENTILSILQEQIRYVISQSNANHAINRSGNQRSEHSETIDGQTSPIEINEQTEQQHTPVTQQTPQVSQTRQTQHGATLHSQLQDFQRNVLRNQSNQHRQHNSRNTNTSRSDDLYTRIIQSMRLQYPNTTRHENIQNLITPNLPQRNNELDDRNNDGVTESTESIESTETAATSSTLRTNNSVENSPHRRNQPSHQQSHQQPHHQYRQRFEREMPSQRYNFYTQFPFSETTNTIGTALNHMDDFINNTLELLEPVVIRPTVQQINFATRRTLFNDIIRPVNTVCPITLIEFQDQNEVMMILHCGHIFMPNELNNWFRYNVRCPMCRYDIRNYTRGLYGSHNNHANEQSTLSNSEIRQNNETNNADDVDDAVADDTEENEQNDNSTSMMETARDSDDESEVENDNNDSNEDDLDFDITNNILESDSMFEDSLLNDISLTHELYNDLYHNDRDTTDDHDNDNNGDNDDEDSDENLNEIAE